MKNESRFLTKYIKEQKQLFWFALILGLLLFIYILVRSIVVAPIHDELATLFHFVDYGTFWRKDMILDANNHLLNSFLAKVCYSIFGDEIWAIRLPNVLSFILFYAAIMGITFRIKHKYLRIFFLIGTTCIPYVLDYFAYCRGYGMSMAFLMVAIFLFLRLNKKFTYGTFIMMLCSLLLGVYANLNLIYTVGLIGGYVGVRQLKFYFKKQKIRSIFLFLGIGIVFMMCLYIPIKFAFLLKNSGALYYGNLEGLWQTTGASLSKLILMSDAVFIKYILLVVLLALVAFDVYILIRNKVQNYCNSDVALFHLLFFGNLIIIEGLRWGFSINYPEDRVGMQLIFLLIGAVAFTLDNIPKLAVFGMLFLTFPILGWKGFNFYTSQFSPYARMEKSDFLLYIYKVEQGEATSIYHTQSLTYAYHVRKHNPEDFFVPTRYTDKQLDFMKGKIISSRSEFNANPIFFNYTKIDENIVTEQTIWKRNHVINWKMVNATDLIDTIPYLGKKMYYSLMDSVCEKYHSKIKISINCEVFIPQLRRENLIFVMDVLTKNGVRKYSAFNLGWAAGKLKQYTFHKTFILQPDELKKVSVYLYNPKQLPFKIMKLSRTIMITDDKM